MRLPDPPTSQVDPWLAARHDKVRLLKVGLQPSLLRPDPVGDPSEDALKDAVKELIALAGLQGEGRAGRQAAQGVGGR